MEALFKFVPIPNTTRFKATEKVGDITIEISGEKNEWKVWVTEYFPYQNKSVCRNSLPVGLSYEKKERAVNKAKYLLGLAKQ